MQLSSKQSEATERTLELLLAAAQKPADLDVLSRAVESWDEVFQAALSHGVEAYLYRALLQAGISLPAALKERTDRWLLIRDVWQSHTETALHEVLPLLEAAQIRAVCLKGPLLGERLYP